VVGKTIVSGLIALAATLSLTAMPFVAEARFLFHATSRAAAKKIMQKGFSTRMMNSKARFGKGAYLSKSKAMALREKPKADAVIKFNESKLLGKSTVNTKSLSKGELKRFSHYKDLRGNIHKGVPGGDLAHKMGNQAGRTNKTIAYPSAKGNGTNVFIPKKVYSEHPQIVKPDSMQIVGR